jgi:hypothetical protein
LADLVTHVASVLIPAGAWADRRTAVWLAFGVAVPDLASRVPSLLLEAVDGWMAMPEAVFWPWGMLHEPLGALLVCGVLAGRVAPDQRSVALSGLSAGALAHICLDLLQDHHGQGYFLLAPFSTWRFELGWVGSEATTTWALPLAGLTAAIWSVRAARAR